jgi:hypothetical protein
MRVIVRFGLLVAGLILVASLAAGPSAQLAGRRWHTAAPLAEAGQIAPGVAGGPARAGGRWS